MIDDSYIHSVMRRLSQMVRLVLDADIASDAAAHARTIGEVLAALEADCITEHLRGLAYVFRLLYKLPMRWPGGSVSVSDRVALAGWVGDLREFLLGGTSREDSAGLVEGLARLSWIPALDTRLVGFVANALGDDTPILHAAALARADAAWSATDVRGSGDARASDSERTCPVEDAAAAVSGSAFVDASTEDSAIDAPSVDGDVFGNKGMSDAAFVDAAPDALAFGDAAFSGEESGHAHADAFAASAFAVGDAQHDTEVAAFTGADTVDAIGWPPQTTLDEPAPAAGAVWISSEELGLVSDAVAAQLLPASAALLDASGRPDMQWRDAVDACSDQLEFVMAALEALGLGALHEVSAGYGALLRRVHGTGEIANEDAQVLGLWPVLLIGHLQDPHDAAAAADLVALLQERDALPAGDGGALAQRLTEVALGVDPALQAVRKRVAESDDIVLDVSADVLPGVLAGMLQELPGRAAGFSASIQRWLQQRAPADIDEARRIAHTLKGDGNIVGVRGIANLTHALEEILVVLAAQPERANASLDELLLDAADALEAMSDRVLGRGPTPADSQALLQRVLDAANALLDVETAAAPSMPTQPTAGALDGAERAEAGERAEAADVVQHDAEQAVTVPMRLLDDLLRLTGEAVIYARQVENRVGRVERRHGDISVQGKTFETLIAELQQLVEVRGAALSNQRLSLGEEFDDLEMDRYNELHTVTLRLVEASADARASAQDLNQDVVALRDMLSQQDRVHLDLAERVRQSRTVPLSGLLPRLQRVVRQTSRQLGKPCELVIEGEHVLLDKELLEGLAEPLLHLLRNAIDHGIEPAAQRSAAGKPAQGRLTLAFAREANMVSIRCRDDGAGLDLDAIRQRAIERGLIEPSELLSAQELSALIFRKGFSTRTQATLTSGRGIGMDIVHRRIAEFKGSVMLRSEAGQGCEFELRLPLSQVAAQVLLSQVAGDRIAINLAGVQRIVLPDPAQLLTHDGRALLQLPDEPAHALVDIYDLLGFRRAAAAAVGERHALLVGTDAQDSVAVLVEAVSDARPVIFKSLGPHVAPNPGLLGATVLGDGSVATVVDLPQLIARHRRSELPGGIRSEPRASVAPVPSVLIVDDSLSVRRSLEQVIGDAGFRVSTARDGLEAVEQVRGERPDVMVIDLEMPRMNGLELTSFIRKEASTRAIPIIMITSRTTERHRELARTAGVDTILSKPYSEDGLLTLIADKLARGRPGGLNR